MMPFFEYFSPAHIDTFIEMFMLLGCLVLLKMLTCLSAFRKCPGGIFWILGWIVMLFGFLAFFVQINHQVHQWLKLTANLCVLLGFIGLFLGYQQHKYQALKAPIKVVAASGFFVVLLFCSPLPPFVRFLLETCLKVVLLGYIFHYQSVLKQNHNDAFRLNRIALMLISGCMLALAVMVSILHPRTINDLVRNPGFLFLLAFSAFSLYILGFSLITVVLEWKALQSRNDALRDVLTGAFNRRILQTLPELVSSYLRKTPWTVAILDIDHFKNINDQFGHLAGDRVLQHLVCQLRRRLLEEDIIIRFGGEEFLILLFGRQSQEALNWAEQMRQLICQHPFIDEQTEIAYSVSIGLTTSEQPFNHSVFDHYVETADHALYIAKLQRNTVHTLSMTPRPRLANAEK